MQRQIIRLVLSCCCCWLLFSTAAGQEWARFRGPNGTGVSNAKTIPVRWSESDYNWKIKLPGIGHSSPTLWGKRLFILSADPDKATRYVLCYDANSGKQLWRRDYPSEPHHLHIRSSFASCTPAVDDERVYIAWSTPAETTFKAFTHDGDEEWSLDLGTWTSQHGFGTSPVLYKDLVILSNSQQARQLKPGQKPGKSFVMAFDKRTGEERWRTSRVSANVCYSVPFIRKSQDGTDELICINTGNGMFSLDPNTGKENWSIDAFKMRTVGSPIAAGGLIFGSTGSGGGGNYVVAVRPGKNPEIVYEIKQAAPYVPCMLAKGETVFLWYDKGVATCINARTGQPYWGPKRIGGGFSGSPVLVDDKIYCIDEDGVVVVLAADTSEFRVLAKNPLGEASRSTPAVAGGRMYLRTYSHLISIGGARL